MKLNPFAKKEVKKARDKVKKTKPEAEVLVPDSKDNIDTINVSGDANTNRVTKNFYISEKASMLNGIGQYVFKVQKTANKSEIKKQISKIFNVTVTDVKIINMPKKLRNIGRHPGIKPGFKKAVVILAKGQSIQQGQHKA